MRCTPAALFSLILVLSSVAGGINSEVQPLEDRDLPQSVGDDNLSSGLAFGWATSAGGALDDFISQSATYANGTFIVAGSYGGDIQFRDQIDGHGATGGSSDRDA
ncbi:MAG: hypothetical protein QNL20_04480, partial [Euryarchaeota archaeon]